MYPFACLQTFVIEYLMLTQNVFHHVWIPIWCGMCLASSPSSIDFTWFMKLSNYILNGGRYEMDTDTYRWICMHFFRCTTSIRPSWILRISNKNEMKRNTHSHARTEQPTEWKTNFLGDLCLRKQSVVKWREKTWHIYELMQHNAGIISSFVSVSALQWTHFYCCLIVCSNAFSKHLWVKLYAHRVYTLHSLHFGTSSSRRRSEFHTTFNSSLDVLANTHCEWLLTQPASQPASHSVWAIESTVNQYQYGWMTMVMMMWRHVALTLVECNKAILPPKWINYFHCLIVVKQKRWLYWHGEQRNRFLFPFYSSHKEQMIQHTI